MSRKRGGGNQRDRVLRCTCQSVCTSKRPPPLLFLASDRTKEQARFSVGKFITRSQGGKEISFNKILELNSVVIELYSSRFDHARLSLIYLFFFFIFKKERTRDIVWSTRFEIILRRVITIIIIIIIDEGDENVARNFIQQRCVRRDESYEYSSVKKSNILFVIISFCLVNVRRDVRLKYIFAS